MKKGWVYMIGSREILNYPVKIGFTGSDIRERMTSLQTGNPVELSVLMVWEGNFELEKKIHAWLGERRIRGEWFHNDPMLEEGISRFVEADEMRARFGYDGSPTDYEAEFSTEDGAKFSLDAAREVEERRAAHCKRVVAKRLAYERRVEGKVLRIPFKA